MERLIRIIKARGESVAVYTKGRYEDTTAGEMRSDDIRNVMKRLHEYEDTGLTPEQIMELKERDTAKGPEPAPMGMDGMVCPSCGKKALPWDRFCGECGQRFWEDE